MHTTVRHKTAEIIIKIPTVSLHIHVHGINPKHGAVINYIEPSNMVLNTKLSPLYGRKILMIVPSRTCRRPFLCPVVSPAIPPGPPIPTTAPAGPDRLELLLVEAAATCQACALAVVPGNARVSLATTCIRLSRVWKVQRREKGERCFSFRVHSSVPAIVISRARLF